MWLSVDNKNKKWFVEKKKNMEDLKDQTQNEKKKDLILNGKVILFGKKK